RPTRRPGSHRHGATARQFSEARGERRPTPPGAGQIKLGVRSGRLRRVPRPPRELLPGRDRRLPGRHHGQAVRVPRRPFRPCSNSPRLLAPPLPAPSRPVSEDPPKQPKRERRHRHPVDADCAEAMRFLQRVKLADAGLYDRVLTLLFHVRAEVTLDANQIYSEARKIFESAHGDLLHGFTEYLPTGRDWTF
uniref:Uncharacterized protein n=1 Tax=Triticum urartu TaxID=4572 RepID=A0A8R7PN99_TRIUA